MLVKPTSSDNERTMRKESVLIGWKAVAPDEGYAWVVVFASFLIHVFADGFVHSFGVVGQSLVKKYDYSNREVSAILSMTSGLMYATGLIAAVLCDKLGCRVVTILGALLAATGSCVSYFATRLIHLIFSVGVLMGIGFGLMYCPAIVMVTVYFEKNRSLATGISVCGSGVGTFALAKLMSYLIIKVGQDNLLTIFPVYGGILLLGVPCGLLFRPVPMEPIYEEDGRELALNKSRADTKLRKISCLGKCCNFLRFSLLSNACFMIYALSSVFVTIGFNAVPMFLPMNAEAVLNQGKEVAGNTVSFYGFANVCGRLFFGWLCDRQLPFKWGKNRERNRVCIFAVVLISSGVACCFVWRMVDFALFFAFSSFFGFVAIGSLTSILLVDFIGVDRLTSGLGLLLLFRAIACILGPFIGGYLFDLTGDYAWTFAFFGFCLITGGLLFPLARVLPGRYVENENKNSDRATLTPIPGKKNKWVRAKRICSKCNGLGNLYEV